jgi:hypothetical protein
MSPRQISPNRLLGGIVGSAFLLLGLGGFLVTLDVGFFESPGGQLFGLIEVNPAHNLLHVLVGGLLAGAAASGVAASRTVNAVAGAVLLLSGLVGLFLVGSPANILAVNATGNALHFAAAVVLLAAGLGTEQPKRAQ